MRHPSCVISPEAEIAEDVEVGPYSMIHGRVRIGHGTRIESHVTIGWRFGGVEIGENNLFFPGAVIGGPPQDITYKNESTQLVIGDRNVFREFTTVNTATTKSEKVTRVGSDNYFMAYTHVGHDCRVGNHVVIANDTHIGGHCEVEDYVTIGGVCAFNQHVRVGKHSFIAGGSEVNKDILPFTKAQGRYCVARATNKIGLQRRGFEKNDIEMVHRAVRIILMGSDTMEEAIDRIRRECGESESILYLIDFIKNSSRGIAR